jgi:hypothetical protein
MAISDEFVATGVRKNVKNKELPQKNMNEYSIWLDKTLL